MEFAPDLSTPSSGPLLCASVDATWNSQQLRGWLIQRGFSRPNDFIISNQLDGSDILELTVHDFKTLGYPDPKGLYEAVRGWDLQTSPNSLSISPPNRRALTSPKSPSNDAGHALDRCSPNATVSSQPQKKRVATKSRESLERTSPTLPKTDKSTKRKAGKSTLGKRKSGSRSSLNGTKPHDSGEKTVKPNLQKGNNGSSERTQGNADSKTPKSGNKSSATKRKAKKSSSRSTTPTSRASSASPLPTLVLSSPGWISPSNESLPPTPLADEDLVESDNEEIGLNAFEKAVQRLEDSVASNESSILEKAVSPTEGQQISFFMSEPTLLSLEDFKTDSLSITKAQPTPTVKNDNHEPEPTLSKLQEKDNQKPHVTKNPPVLTKMKESQQTNRKENNDEETEAKGEPIKHETAKTSSQSNQIPNQRNAEIKIPQMNQNQSKPKPKTGPNKKDKHPNPPSDSNKNKRRKLKFKSSVPGVRDALLRLGWAEHNALEDTPNDWNLWWKAGVFRPEDVEDCQPWQRLNHFRNTGAICKKDSLARLLRKMEGLYGKVFLFMPQSFIVPMDYPKFLKYYESEKSNDPESQSTWIYKPAAGRQGRGIFLFQDINDLAYESIPGSAVVQRYIHNPLLINGYKFDLRLYVVVTSYHPLKVYMFREGLARFSTHKYDMSDLDNVFVHLTNTSINKTSPNISDEKDGIGPGCKFPLSTLREHFRRLGINDGKMWQRISAIVVLTIISLAAEVPHARNSFELLGFDVLVDDRLKPWLMEVNFSPALSPDCETDYIVKPALLRDIIRLINYQEDDIYRGNIPKKEDNTRSRYGPQIYNTEPKDVLKQENVATLRKQRLSVSSSSNGNENEENGKLPFRQSVSSKLRMEAQAQRTATANRNAALKAARLEAKSKSKFIIEPPKTLRKLLPKKDEAPVDVEKEVPRNVGGMVRIFPFNEATCRAAQESGRKFDTRLMVTEVKQHLATYNAAKEQYGPDALESHSRWVPSDRPEGETLEGEDKPDIPCYYYPEKDLYDIIEMPKDSEEENTENAASPT
eukprot:m.53539 g.53539  ORF g.53539 m.53539 type:complete len:1039 (-) comp10871_c0_seq3:472-3588(-)